ncbi:MAG: HupE/UreJ family protein [Acidobacteria bacterium]|nr:HupE/UreJ family protein [Acidobacteriota bacterium]
MATVRLVGIVPSGARTFTWRSSLVYGSYPLVIKNGGEEQGLTQWLEGGRDSEPFPVVADIKRVSRTAVARQYLALGFTHILPKGVDHILFVLGIFLLTTRWRPVLTQVTAFTLAHSITLGLTIYGIVSLPPAVVEPLIALSIAYVAIENLVTSELKPWRVALVFGFGLLHGMGFAGVLRELGLPRSEFMTALVTFNPGVEGGQLTVIGMAFLALACWRSNPTSYRRLIVVPASLMMAITGLYWTVQRLTAA